MKDKKPKKKKHSSKLHLKPGKSFIYRGTMNYLVAYDYSAGRKHDYTLMILCDGDPVIVGREISKGHCRELIEEYEAEAKKLPCWCGARRDVLKCKINVGLRKRVNEQERLQHLQGPGVHREESVGGDTANTGDSPGDPGRDTGLQNGHAVSLP